MATEYAPCPVCGREYALTKAGTIRHHYALGAGLNNWACKGVGQMPLVDGNAPSVTAVDESHKSESADFDGCNRRCRTAGTHTLQWGGCEFAPEPPAPTPVLPVVFTATDGHRPPLTARAMLLVYGKSTASDGQVSRSAELHAHVVARWQEKLDTARAATPWPDVGIVVEGIEQGAPFVASEATVAHIAAFDPAFSIAVCESALRRLERHRPTFVVDEPPIIWYCDDQGDPWPCPEMLDDAAPFAGLADFPEEFR